MNKIFPKKHLGQNFLVDNEVLNDVIQAAELEKDDIVLEIGAGAGVLTMVLAEKAKRVVAVEKDPELAKNLESRIKNSGLNNVEIICEDIRNLYSKFQIPNSKFKIVANIPYYLTGFIIRNFLLEAEILPQLVILMVQKEVGERIVARPLKTSFLSNAINYIGFAEIVRFVPAGAFWPKPKVDSAIIKIKPNKKTPPLSKRRRFFAFLKMAFGQPRKTLVNNLSVGLKLPKEKIAKILSSGGLKDNIRPGELDLKGFLTIFQFSK